MGTAIKISRTEFTPTQLRAFAARSDDPGQTRRLLAIALVLEGASRAEAARRLGWIGKPCMTGSSASTKAVSMP